MKQLTHRVLQHKRIVIIGWVVLTIVGLMSAGPATKALDQKFTVPGKEGWDASQQIKGLYGNGGPAAAFVPVVQLPAGKTVDSPGVKQELRRVETRVKGADRRIRVSGFGSTGNRAFVSEDGRTAFVYAAPPEAKDAFGDNTELVNKVERSLASTTVAGAKVHVTGYDALVDDNGGDTGGTGVLLEAVLGGFGALLVLIFVFGSFLALIPLLMAICSVLVTFLLLWGLTTIADISPVVQFLVALVGLGVAIDYSLLLVTRWREERDQGLDNEAAVEAAMATSGRAVVFSGTTVAIGLLALIVLPLPFMRSMGYGGMLIPLVATLSAITLLPTLLATVGPRMDKRRLRKRDNSDANWQRWSQGVVKRRWPAHYNGDA